MPDTDFERRQFIELLPFYLNGTLDEQQRQHVNDYLGSHPEARADLKFSAEIASAVQSPIYQRDEMAGYDVLQKRLGFERNQEQLSSPKRAPTKIDFRRWRITITDLFCKVGLSPAMAVLLLMVTAQIAVTSSSLMQPTDTSEYRGSQVASRAAQLSMTADPKASLESILALLLENQCKIVWGPSASGELWLTVDVPGSAEAVREHLAASPLVQSIKIIPTQKAK